MKGSAISIESIVRPSDYRFTHVAELALFLEPVVENEMLELDMVDPDDVPAINNIVSKRSRNIPTDYPSSYFKIKDGTRSRAVADFTIMHVDDGDNVVPIVQDLIDRERRHGRKIVTTSYDKVDQTKPWKSMHNTEIPDHVMRNVLAMHWIHDGKKIDVHVPTDRSSIHDDEAQYAGTPERGKLNPVAIEYLHGKDDTGPYSDDTVSLMDAIIGHVDVYTAFDAAIRSRKYHGLPIHETMVTRIADRLIAAEADAPWYKQPTTPSDLTNDGDVPFPLVRDIEMAIMTGMDDRHGSRYSDEKNRNASKYTDVRKDFTKKMLGSSIHEIVNTAVESRREQVDAKTWITETWAHPNQLTRRAIWYIFDAVPEMFGCTELRTIVAIEKERGFEDKRRHQNALSRLRYKEKKNECHF